MDYYEIYNCRICNGRLECIFDIGTICLTGIFPNKDETIPKVPLTLAKCDNCELIQLKHNFDIKILYGETYGYRSGLNNSMVNHLHDIVKYLQNKIQINNNDFILDIGSNDGTLLNLYSNRKNINFVGIDPSANKFKKYYNSDVKIVCDFFNKEVYDQSHFEKAKIITTISMFYDLDNPIKFTQDIYDVLDDNGLWFTEQSYFLSMINSNSFDTICQEHIEYYCLKQIKYLADIVGFKIIDISFNDTNGGSFCCLMAKRHNNNFSENTEFINKVLNDETNFFKNGFIEKFTNKIINTKNLISDLFETVKKENKVIHGYGASTKGNVLLQYFNINSTHLDCICEINEDKFGKVTPGSNIPIVSNEESKMKHPDYYFVLPWHFKNNIIAKEMEYLKNGGKLVFPLPEFDIVTYERFMN